MKGGLRMPGLTQEQLIDILNDINDTTQVKKADLHEAIAEAIMQNTDKMVQDINEIHDLQYSGPVERNRIETEEMIQQHLDEYH